MKTLPELITTLVTAANPEAAIAASLRAQGATPNGALMQLTFLKALWQDPRVARCDRYIPSLPLHHVHVGPAYSPIRRCRLLAF